MLITTSYSNAKRKTATKTSNFTFIAWFVCCFATVYVLWLFFFLSSFAFALVVPLFEFFLAFSMAPLWWQILSNKHSHLYRVTFGYMYMCVCMSVSELFIVSNGFLISVSTSSDFFLAQSNYGLAKSILKCNRKGVDNCFARWCDNDGNHFNSMPTMDVRVW